MRKIIVLLIALFFLQGCKNEIVPQENSPQSTMEETLPNETMESDQNDNPLISWEEKEVVIKELQNDYEVWFLSDLHMVSAGDDDSSQVKEYALERSEVFNLQQKEDPQEILAQFIELANENKPDLVIFGGDIIDFPSKSNLSCLKENLQKLDVPYLFVMGNHDWTYPWEYMTQEGSHEYRPKVENITGVDSYAGMLEREDIVFLAIDNSSNQVAAQAANKIEEAYATQKPIVLIQHVPFSTEKLIARAKDDWSNPVTLGMQVHGGIPVNEVSGKLYQNVLQDESQIRLILAGHVHFSYEEMISQNTKEIIGDAAFKGSAVKIIISRE